MTNTAQSEPSQLSLDLQPPPKKNDEISKQSSCGKISALEGLAKAFKKGKDKGKYSVLHIATRGDVVHLLTLGKEMQDDADIIDDIDPEVVMQTVTYTLADQERSNFNIFLLYRYDKPVGFLVASCNRSLYNRRIVAQSHLWFVTKKYRTVHSSLLLLHEYEQWARTNSATHIYTGSVNMRNSERLSKLLTRYGYPCLGYLHMKEV
jgi:hypothetical protein